MSNDGWTLLLAATVSSATALVAVWLRHVLSKKRACDPIEKETKFNQNVYTALDFTLNEMKADRAYVLEFHNGIHYFSGRSQQKFSCSYEVVEEGISAECQNSQDHKISNYHNYISTLVDNGKFSFEEISKVEDHIFQSLLRHKGVKSIFNVPIKTLNGKMIGILGVDYVAQASPVKFDEETHKFFKRQARVIAGYLL
jgi:hypothetical protein